MMDKFHLQKLRDLPIEGVAERLNLRVERHKCLCPFHEDHTPSLRFKYNRYKCYACGESGDTISLAMKRLGKGFIEACKWLANESLTPIPSPRERGEKSPSPKGGGWEGASRYERYFEHPFLNDEARRFLFEERRLDPRVVRWCRLTSWRDRQGINWLQIPYYNQEGKLVGIQNRNLVKDAKPRFRFPQGAECGIYNLPVLNRLKPGDTLYIAEGCSDCWSLLSAGHKAIAIPSATLLKRKDAEQLSIINSQLSIKFAMFPDNDLPGERLFLQLKEVLPNLVHHQLPPGCKDYSEYYLKYKTTDYAD